MSHIPTVKEHPEGAQNARRLAEWIVGLEGKVARKPVDEQYVRRRGQIGDVLDSEHPDSEYDPDPEDGRWVVRCRRHPSQAIYEHILHDAFASADDPSWCEKHGKTAHHDPDDESWQDALQGWIFEGSGRNVPPEIEDAYEAHAGPSPRLWRGESAHPDEYKVGAEVTRGIRSWTTEQDVAHSFAHERAEGDEQRVPTVLELEPGGRSASLAELGDTPWSAEHLTRGRFKVTHADWEPAGETGAYYGHDRRRVVRLRQLDHGKTAAIVGDLPQRLWHVAPARHRPSIQQHGIDWQRGEGNWGGEANYLLRDRDAARDWINNAAGNQDEPMDIWRVDHAGLELHDDPEFEGFERNTEDDEQPDTYAFMTKDKIEPHRLELVDTYDPRENAVEWHTQHADPYKTASSDIEESDSPLEYRSGGPQKRLAITDESFAGDPDHPYFKAPGTISFLDYSPMGENVHIEYGSTHPSHRGQGHQGRLVDELYRRFPGDVNFGKIMDPPMGKIYERHRADPEHGPRTHGKNWYSHMIASRDPETKTWTLYRGTNSRELAKAQQQGEFPHRPGAMREIASEVEDHHGLPRGSVYNHPAFGFNTGRRDTEDSWLYLTEDPRVAASYARAGNEPTEDALNAAHQLKHPEMWGHDINSPESTARAQHLEGFKSDYLKTKGMKPVVAELHVPDDLFEKHERQVSEGKIHMDVWRTFHDEAPDEQVTTFMFRRPFPASTIAKVHDIEPGPRGVPSKQAADDDVPPLPGETPIPKGHVRLFHVTPLRNLESIRAHGLGLEHAKGQSYGEPNMVWASSGINSSQAKMVTEGGIMDSDRAVVEFHAHPNELDIGRFSTPEELEGRQSDVTLYHEVKPENIVAIHEPWHAAHRYLSEYKDEVKAGEYDYAADISPNYARAIDKIKKTTSSYWKTCDQGHEHWGPNGAAGILYRHKGSDDTRYLLQHRGEGVQHGGTWSTPGGAIDEGEEPEDAAKREVSEELGHLPASRSAEHHVDDHGGWAYHTFVHDVDEPFGTDETNWEHGGAKWFTEKELRSGKVPLHPGFKNFLDTPGTRVSAKEETYYHVAYPEHRDSIRQNGLWTSEHARDKDWGGEKGRVYLHDDLEFAQDMAGIRDSPWESKDDVWEVKVDPKKVHPDPDWYEENEVPPEDSRWHYHEGPVAPDKVRLVTEGSTTACRHGRFAHCGECEEDLEYPEEREPRDPHLSDPEMMMEDDDG